MTDMESLMAAAESALPCTSLIVGFAPKLPLAPKFQRLHLNSSHPKHLSKGGAP